MAKMRGIKPEIWTDERFVSVSPMARLLFIGMWNFMCDNGHITNAPKQIKMRVLPGDACDVAPLIDELVDVGLLDQHEGYLKSRTLSKHQRIDKRYLALCEHCEHDEKITFLSREAYEATKGTQREHEEDAAGAQRGNDVYSTGPRAEGKGREGRGREGEKKRREGEEKRREEKDGSARTVNKTAREELSSRADLFDDEWMTGGAA